MRIKQVAEICWTFFYDGRPKATAQTLSQEDFKQMCLLAFANNTRATYYKSKQLDQFNEPDYSFISPILDTRRFTLTEANIIGMRRADMCDTDLFRLPKNAHFTNVYPVGADCNGIALGEVTQVCAGEENFYLSPDFTSFLFYVVKGRGLNTYNLPPCVKEVDVESTYNADDIDISMDLAYDVIMAVLGTSIKVNGIPIKILDNPYSPQPHEVKKRLQETEQ